MIGAGDEGNLEVKLLHRCAWIGELGKRLCDPLEAVGAGFFAGVANRYQLCVLLDKQARRVQKVDADFVGFECPDEFVVGYGLDHANFYRELPYIGALGIPAP